MDVSKNDIRIRNAGAADCEQLAAWWNDGKIMAHAGFPNGLGTTPEHIREEIADDTDDTKRRLIIEYKGTPIGEMSYYNLGGNVAEMGIKICNTDYQEKGLGRTILSMLITELFERGYEKIVLDTNLKNERAQHVYEMLGFRRLRVNIDSWEDQLGELQSSVDYELVPGDFQDYSA